MSRYGSRIGGMTAVAPESVTIPRGRGWGWEGAGRVKQKTDSPSFGLVNMVTFSTQRIQMTRDSARIFSLPIDNAAARGRQSRACLCLLINGLIMG